MEYLEQVLFSPQIEQAIRLFSGRPKYETSIMKWKTYLKFLGDYINGDLK